MWYIFCLTDSRVTVVSLEDGSLLTGEEAPRRRDLDSWLDNHPGYMVDRPDPEDEVVCEIVVALQHNYSHSHSELG